MQKTTKMLIDRKRDLDHLDVPDELEMRLQAALVNKTRSEKPKINLIIKAAAVLLVILLAGYQSDSLAFYGRKLIGYDNVMNGTLKQLNEIGKGQGISKSYTFKDGVTVTLDGIMLDDNQLLAFYSTDNPTGQLQEDDSFHLLGMSLEGKDSYYMQSAAGEFDEEKGQMRYIASFESPHIFEKDLSLSFWYQESDIVHETGRIDFTLDRKKAMGHSLKRKLHESFNVAEGKIRLESITASPTSTVVKGSIQKIWELGWDQITGERIRPNEIILNLIANGKEVPWQGRGLSTDMKGINFQQEFDALPADLEKLQIQLFSFEADHDVNQEIELKRKSSQSTKILGQELQIDEVYESQGDTYITITTEETVLFTKVHLLIDGEKVSLEETIYDLYDKKNDGTAIHTRTLHFMGTGVQLELDIERMTYAKNYNETIDIALD